MSTTNTDYAWHYFIRKKGARRYLGLVNESGAAPSTALTDALVIHYDEIPDEYTSDDDSWKMPDQYELSIIKGVAAELIMMDPSADQGLAAKYDYEYERGVTQAIHDQIKDSQQPMVLKPLDLRDD